MHIKKYASMLLALLGSVSAASALTFTLDTEFSGGADPSGAPVATLTQVDADTVRFTLDLTNLSGTEFVSGWYFNLDPNLDSTALTFSGFDTSDISSWSALTGENAYKADGDGYFDLLFTFPESGDRFGDGDVVVIDVSLADGLLVSAFDYESVEGGGNGSWGSAAHVQAIGAEGDSGWVGGPGEDEPGPPIPEPSSYATGIGVIALAWVILRRRAKSERS